MRGRQQKAGRSLKILGGVHGGKGEHDGDHHRRDLRRDENSSVPGSYHGSRPTDVLDLRSINSEKRKGAIVSEASQPSSRHRSRVLLLSRLCSQDFRAARAVADSTFHSKKLFFDRACLLERNKSIAVSRLVPPRREPSIPHIHTTPLISHPTTRVTTVQHIATHSPPIQSL